VDLDPPLDAMMRVMTPERIAFEFPLGGPFRRFTAYLLDLLVLSGLVVGASMISLFFALGSEAGLGPALVAYFLISWGYGAFCEGVLNGQTPGKRVLGLRAISARGVPITIAQAIVRNLVGAVDGLLPFLYLPGLCSMLLTERFQRLGDLAAGTVVIQEERRLRKSLTRIDSNEVRLLLDRLPARIAAGSNLSRGLSDYVRRRLRLGPSRREEIAGPLARPLAARYGLPSEASSDAVLCAIYHRVFLGD
jgi:uncharacterized RDD family membrane protein YckC